MTDVTNTELIAKSEAFNDAVNLHIGQFRGFTEGLIVGNEADPLAVVLAASLSLAETAYILAIQRETSKVQIDAMFEALFSDMKDRMTLLYNSGVGIDAEVVETESDNA